MFIHMVKFFSGFDLSIEWLTYYLVSFIYLFLFQQWYDEFMAWDAEEFPGVKYLVVRSDEIWTPDIMAINAWVYFGFI